MCLHNDMNIHWHESGTPICTLTHYPFMQHFLIQARHIALVSHTSVVSRRARKGCRLTHQGFHDARRALARWGFTFVVLADMQKLAQVHPVWSCPVLLLWLNLGTNHRWQLVRFRQKIHMVRFTKDRWHLVSNISNSSFPGESLVCDPAGCDLLLRDTMPGAMTRQWFLMRQKEREREGDLASQV